jgi:hypothetical protein
MVDICLHTVKGWDGELERIWKEAADIPVRQQTTILLEAVSKIMKNLFKKEGVPI